MNKNTITWQEAYMNLLSNPVAEANKLEYDTQPKDYDVIFPGKGMDGLVLAVGHEGQLNVDDNGEVVTSAIGESTRTLAECVAYCALVIVLWGDEEPFVHPSWEPVLDKMMKEGKYIFPGQGLEIKMTQPHTPPSFWGPIGRGDAMERMYKDVTIRKDGKGGWIGTSKRRPSCSWRIWTHDGEYWFGFLKNGVQKHVWKAREEYKYLAMNVLLEKGWRKFA